MITLPELIALLRAHPDDMPLVFASEAGDIGPGYHVTELRHSASTGIDCGGTIEAWPEVRLQLLDGTGRTHMPAGKFVGILERSLKALPALAQAPVIVEFAPGNRGLRLMLPDAPQAEDGRLVLRLNETRAVCKPAERSAAARAPGEQAACCGTAAVSEAHMAAAACCTPSAEARTPGGCCA